MHPFPRHLRPPLPPHTSEYLLLAVVSTRHCFHCFHPPNRRSRRVCCCCSRFSRRVERWCSHTAAKEDDAESSLERRGRRHQPPRCCLILAPTALTPLHCIWLLYSSSPSSSVIVANALSLLQCLHCLRPPISCCLCFWRVRSSHSDLHCWLLCCLSSPSLLPPSSSMTLIITYFTYPYFARKAKRRVHFHHAYSHLDARVGSPTCAQHVGEFLSTGLADDRQCEMTSNGRCNMQARVFFFLLTTSCTNTLIIDHQDPVGA